MESPANDEALSPRIYTFIPPGENDGSDRVTYALRGLRDEEVKPWAAFCASIFAYKANPPPPAYFERHYFNDPRRKASLIRVAFTNDDDNDRKIVASCRIFERQISDGKGGSILAGGIGEVCTSNDHRRRGLSRELMRDCIDIMTKYGMKASILHAAPAFFPVYQSMGYECTTSRWSLVEFDVNLNGAKNDYAAFECRHAKFPDDALTMKSLHHAFSESQFTGCIFRSEAYWNTYLSTELKGTLFVLADPATAVPFAWLSLRPRGDRWQLREFCYSAPKNNSDCTLSQAMRILTRKAVSSSTDGDVQRLHLPTFLVDQLKVDSAAKSDYDWIKWDTLMEENDNGWMYRPLGEDGVSVVTLSQSRPHLIWPADSF